jgi:hypothetical protein
MAVQTSFLKAAPFISIDSYVYMGDMTRFCKEVYHCLSCNNARIKMNLPCDFQPP